MVAGRKIVPLSMPAAQLYSTITSCGPLPDTFAPVGCDTAQLPAAGAAAVPCAWADTLQTPRVAPRIPASINTENTGRDFPPCLKAERDGCPVISMCTPESLRLLRAGAELGCRGALGHHREVALHAGRADDEWMLLADFALGGDQSSFRVGAVVLAVIREHHRGAGIGGRLGDPLLRVDVLIPSRRVAAECAGQGAAGVRDRHRPP